MLIFFSYAYQNLAQTKTTKRSATKTKTKPRHAKTNDDEHLFNHRRHNTDTDGDLSLNFDDEIITTSFEINQNEPIDDSLHLTTTVLTLSPVAGADDDFLGSFEQDGR